MENNGVEIEDTFAEGFGIKVSRIIITAATKHLAEITATEATGYGCSVIGCPAEAGIDTYVPPTETPDGRPGYAIMICHMSKDDLDEEIMNRIGQCVLTAPTAAAFNAIESDDGFATGSKLKFFGDGYQTEKDMDGRKMHVIPIMSGEFLVEDTMGFKEGVAGGNFFIMADSQLSAVVAAEAAADAIKAVPGVITPFPGGMVASGSKVGSKYKFLSASTNEKECVTLKDVVDTELPDDVFGMVEIVIDGVDEASVRAAMKAGIEAACTAHGVLKIGAGNYGGDLGPYQIHLKDL